MDILNFISWIANKRRVVTTAPNDALVPIGIRTESRDDKYTTVAIKKSDLLSGPASTCCSVDIEGNYIAGDSSTNTVTVNPGGTHNVPDFSGMVIVNDHYDGGIELWICGGGDCTLLNTTSAAPGNSTFTQNGNGYEWTNVDNLNGPFTFTVIKTRDSA